MTARRQIDGADVLLGVVALVGAGAYLYEASQVPESLLDDAVGAKGLPIAIGWAMAGLGLALCLRGLLFRARLVADARTAIDREEDSNPARRHLAAAGLLAILALYVVLLPYAGYVVSTALLIGAVAGSSGASLGRNLVLVAVAGSVIIWVLFDPLLGISLSAGSWWQGR